MTIGAGVAGWTKGPWKVAERPYGVTVIDEDGNLVIGVNYAGDYSGTAWAEIEPDDAHLIAAAPDLYEALAGWLPIAESQFKRFPPAPGAAAWEAAKARLEASRAALAKARGAA